MAIWKVTIEYPNTNINPGIQITTFITKPTPAAALARARELSNELMGEVPEFINTRIEEQPEV